MGKLNDIYSLSPVGKIHITPTNPPGPPLRYVYQRTAHGKGNVVGAPNNALQLRRHVIPIDPATPAQLARRALVSLAQAAWANFDAETKANWRTKGVPRRITGHNAWTSWCLKNLTYSPTSGWDNGLSTWDGGGTVWDAITQTIWDGTGTLWDNGTTSWT